MEKQTDAAFGKRNYRLLGLGLAVMATGFVLMTLDREPYGFGMLGLTVGPLVVLAGLGLQFFAILLPANPKSLRP